MSNILIRGCPGTGKTFVARTIAYYMCIKNLNETEAFEQDMCLDQTAIEQFLNAHSRCEFIQVYPDMEFSDIVYGIEVKAGKGLNISFAEKRVMELCNRARERTEKYCIILDDINRANTSKILANLLYAMEYRNQDMELPDGTFINIPKNVILILTENTLDQGNSIDSAVRRRMTYVKELTSSKEIIRKYYLQDINHSAMRIVLDLYDRVQDYIYSNFESSQGIEPGQYVPGHGMYLVARQGNVHFILDNIRQKIRFQIIPYLNHLYSMGLLKVSPHTFAEQILTSINVGIKDLCSIKSIRKMLLRKHKEIQPFSLTDTRNYYQNTIVPARCSDFRGMMECILDALILNGIFPHDVLLSSLLQNTDLAFIHSLHEPSDKAAYMVEKHKANRFMYETVRRGRVSGTHAYFTLDPAVTGRWALFEDTEEYVVTYNDGKPDVELIPLSGFRNHGFHPDSPELGVRHNTVNIMSAVHILLNKYLELYKINMELVMGTDSNDVDLVALIKLEQQYLEAVKQALKSRSSDAPTGDEGRLAYYGNKISNLRLLWHGVDECIEVDADKFTDLVCGAVPFTIAHYEELFHDINGDKKVIIMKGILKMVGLKDYQKIMENIGIHQMIFQGPPGTSKTFESKRFVLSQLCPGHSILSKTIISQQDISCALDKYKLTDADYADPLQSEKRITGGWDLVQFHPSYGYEDFIRGIEVKIPLGSTTPSYESVNRILGKIAEFAKVAADQPDGQQKPKFYLIIDEINRANLATVFGELIYGLEYRNCKVSTPYEVKEKVSGDITKDMILGKNLFLIGTMNTADKSVDAIDYAIRRRFIFIDSPPDREVVRQCYQNASGNTDENSIELFLFDAVSKLFVDERFFNSEYQKNDVQIGHTYFLRDRKKGYEDVVIGRFIFQVIPILREYFKDGILYTTENLIPMEHTVIEIHNSQSSEQQITLLSENIMMYVQEFGNLNQSNVRIDNTYIGKFLDDLCLELGY